MTHTTIIALACLIMLNGCANDRAEAHDGPDAPDAADARDIGQDLAVYADSGRDAAPDGSNDVGLAADLARDTGSDLVSLPDVALGAGCASRPATLGNIRPVVTEVPITNLVPGLYTQFLTGDVAIGGDTLAVGAPHESTDANSDHAGVMVFRYVAGDWALEEELRANVNFDPEQALGRWVEVSSTGNTVLATGVRSAFIFRREAGVWNGPGALTAPFEDDLIADVAVTDTHAAIGYYPQSGRSGAVVVYRLDGTNWVVEQSISDARFDSSSGTAVGLDGAWLAIAARRQFDDVSYIYRRQGSTWVETEEVIGAVDADIEGTHLLTRSRVMSGGTVSTALQVHELGPLGWEHCETIACNAECDASVRGGRIAHSGAPNHVADGFGQLLRFNGADWGADYVADFEGGAVDLADRFAVMRQAREPQIRVIRFEP